jgi:hypothetical protein
MTLGVTNGAPRLGGKSQMGLFELEADTGR